MSTPDKEWEDRVRLIMDEEEEGAAPAQDVTLPTTFVGVDWSQQPTPLEALEAAIVLESSGIRVPLATKARLLGFSLEDLDTQTGVVTEEPAERGRAMVPGRIVEYNYIKGGKISRGVWKLLVPGMEMRLRFICGNCVSLKERDLASWQLGAVASKGDSEDKVRAGMQRLADAGCAECQRQQIEQMEIDMQTATTGQTYHRVAAQYDCPICGTPQGVLYAIDEPFLSEDEVTKLGWRMVKQRVVCKGCLDIVDPAIYKDGEGLL